VSAILTLDPQARPTATDCLEAPWLQSNAGPPKGITRNPSVRLAEYNREYNDKRKKAQGSQ